MCTEKRGVSFVCNLYLMVICVIFSGYFRTFFCLNFENYMAGLSVFEVLPES